MAHLCTTQLVMELGEWGGGVRASESSSERLAQSHLSGEEDFRRGMLSVQGQKDIGRPALLTTMHVAQ